MKKLIYILVSISLLACKPQKSITEYKYITKTDTLIRSEINTIYKGVTDTITIDNPCDSVGIINSFYTKLVLPNGIIEIKSNKKNNQLTGIVRIDDVVSSNKSQKQSSNAESITTKTKEVIKYRIPSWLIIALIIETFIIIAYLYLKYGFKR